MMTPLTDEQKKLVEEHQLDVRRMAENRALRTPSEVTADDLHSAGNIGLMKAAASYDPTRNVPFGAYMQHRVRGEMSEYLRSIDPLTRAHRRKLRAASETLHTLSLNVPRFHDDYGEAVQWADYMADPTDRSVIVDRDDLRRFITDGLSRNERLVITLYYYEGMTMKAIGKVLALSESRVSQMLKQLLERLRATLSEAVLS